MKIISKFLNPKKKFLVIFRGINTEYYNQVISKVKQEIKKILGIEDQKRLF